MRYHFDTSRIQSLHYGTTYLCNHLVYRKCTLYLIDGKGLAVIQQKFDRKSKSTSWGPIDLALRDPIYLHPKFKEFFDAHAGEPVEHVYPTVTVRQLMWALRMKPIKRERWETIFDRLNI